MERGDCDVKGGLRTLMLRLGCDETVGMKTLM